MTRQSRDLDAGRELFAYGKIIGALAVLDDFECGTFADKALSLRQKAEDKINAERERDDS